MQDNQSLVISEELRQYVEALVEEVLVEGKPFDNQKKYLQKFCEAEGVDFYSFERNLADFLDTMEEYKNSKSKSVELLVRHLARKCGISDEEMMKLTGNVQPTPAPVPSRPTPQSSRTITEFVALQRVMRNGKLEEVNDGRRVISPCSWDLARGFHEGMCFVKGSDGLFGYIDTTGRLVIPCKWKVARDFSEGLALVSEDYDNYFFLDKSGNIAITVGSELDPYQNCGGFHKGLAVVQDKRSEKFGFIDKTGRIAIPCRWTYASGFMNNGMATVQNAQEKTGCINTEGELVIPCKFDDDFVFSEGLAILYSERDGFYAIDEEGQKVFDIPYDACDTLFKEGYASIYDVGFIDTYGGLAIEDVWSPQWMGFSEGLAPTEEGFIDESGDVVIAGDWEQCKEFKEGLAPVCKNGKWGYIDRSGRYVIPCIWDSADAFSDGLACVRLSGGPNSRFGESSYVINERGEVLCQVKSV